MPALDPSISPSWVFEKALALRDASPVFFHIDKDGFDVLDPTTGELSHLRKKQFESLYVRGWQVPEHLRHKLAAIPSYREWRISRKGEGDV